MQTTQQAVNKNDVFSNINKKLFDNLKKKEISLIKCIARILLMYTIYIYVYYINTIYIINVNIINVNTNFIAWR